nr:NAD(P)H-hydrate dehydratase [uncultured Desulfuromonas sp.]
MKLVSAQQMRQLDQAAIQEFGVPGIVLMENAGHGAARIIDDRYQPLFPGPVFVVAGKGNNGGDGYVIARHLENWGWMVKTVVLADHDAIQGDAAVNLNILINSQADLEFAPDSASFAALSETWDDAVLLIDAVFGNGLNSEVKGHYRLAIEWMNAYPAPVAAVDMPSGVEATSGRILGAAVEADCSLSFAFAKLGQVCYPAQQCSGELYVVDLGMPQCLCDSVSCQYALVDTALASSLVPSRHDDDHKGTFGHVFVVAGSVGKVGAARMTAHAALRGGAGLVSVAIDRELVGQLMAETPELMSRPLLGEDGQLTEACFDALKMAWSDMSVLAVGPGLGTTETIAKLVVRLVAECPLPLVLDADALTALSGQLDCLAQRKAAAVITPHPGEMARLTGRSISDVQENRIEVARQFAREYGVVVLLKGAHTVIVDGERVWINSSGNSGMASAGMGDVLTGMIAAFVSQGVAPFEAAALSAYLHGAAADLCRKQYGSVGYLAGDVLVTIPVARQLLQEECDA